MTAPQSLCGVGGSAEDGGRCSPRSEERDFLLQVIPLPDREAAEVLRRHPEHAEELGLGEVPLPGRERETERSEVRGQSGEIPDFSCAV